MLLSTNSFQSALKGNEIQSAFLHYTPPCWIICFLGCIAAADSLSIAPLPFKVKQTLHSASPHSHREKKLVFSHFRLFSALPSHAPMGKKFPFRATLTRGRHMPFSVASTLHLFHGLVLPHACFSGGPQLSARIPTAERQIL